MASKRKKVAKAVPISSADLAKVTQATPYVQRLLDDSDLRDDITTVLDSTRSAWDRLSNSKHPGKAVLDDKKLKKNVQTAVDAGRDAASRIQEKPKKKRRGRKLLFLIVAAGVALVVSEALRSKVLDALFGAEEEFQYTPPAPSSSPPPASPVSAA